MSNDQVAYCGLYCGTCIHASLEREGCPGCRNGGGAKDCVQRSCSVGKGLDGCWECKEFPCSLGFFTDEAWKGLCIGCSEVIKESGVEVYARLVREKLGEKVELGDYRFKTAEDIKAILRSDD